MEGLSGCLLTRIRISKYYGEWRMCKKMQRLEPTTSPPTNMSQ